MSRLDRFYRAFGEYRRQVSEEREISALRGQMSGWGGLNFFLSISRFLLTKFV